MHQSRQEGKSKNAREKIIEAVLAKYQAVLSELHEHAASIDGYADKYGLPPTDLYVEQLTKYEDHSPRIAQWRVSREQIVPLPAIGPEYSPGQRNRGYHEHGIGEFALSPDLKKLWFGWQVGPLYGKGFRYDIIIDSAGSVSLENEHQTWVS